MTVTVDGFVAPGFEPVAAAFATKGATAIYANLLIRRGELDPDAPVAHYWPEFRANGKEQVLVRRVTGPTS